jgi:acyl carrier protein
MQDDIENRVKQLMADILYLDPRNINATTEMDNTPRWDSTNHISLVLALEEEFALSFDVTEIEQMLSFPDVVRAVMAKK